MSIDYVSDVFKVVSNAELIDNENKVNYADCFYIVDGDGNKISDDCKTSAKAWQSAYETLKQQNKL